MPGRCSIVCLWLSLLLSMVLGGCADDLPEATLIERMRVLGARLEVVGDETRSTPRPGERLHITLPTVFDTLEKSVDDVQAMLIRCTAPSQFTGGLPVCQEFLDAALDQSADVAAALDMAQRFTCNPLLGTFQQSGVSLSCLSGEPTVELPIPADFEADNALILGIVCERGAPYLDPTEETLFGCDAPEPEGGEEPFESILINGQFPVLADDADDDQVNHNPTLNGLELEMDSDLNGKRVRGPWLAPLPETRLLEEGCDRAQHPQFLRGEDLERHEIAVRYDPKQVELGPDGEPEPVEIEIFATRGDMERRFTVFDETDTPVPLRDADGDPRLDDDGEPILRFEETIEWEPPSFEEVLAELNEGRPEDDQVGIEGFNGLLTRFFITVRDGRGGFALAQRAVCLTANVRDP